MNSRQKAFTIVELLIVIVVIAILAAITIVSYNGVQNKAKASAAKSLAASVSKAAELHAIQVGGAYPTQAELTSTSIVKIDPSAITAAGVSPTNEKQIRYNQCTGAAGAQIIYRIFPSGTEDIVLGICS